MIDPVSETPPDDAIPLAMAERVLQQGELFLQAQLDSALASDQRAMTTAAFFASVAAAITAGVIAYWDNSAEFAVLIAGLSGAMIMAIGACVCLWAARPVDFYFPGTHPACWEGVIHLPLNEVLWGEAQNYQDNIEKNAALLEKNGKVLYRGAMLAAASPLVAIALWLLFSTIYPSSPAGAALDGSHSPSSVGASSHTPQ